jgi:hypothetical protein
MIPRLSITRHDLYMLPAGLVIVAPTESKYSNHRALIHLGAVSFALDLKRLALFVRMS